MQEQKQDPVIMNFDKITAEHIVSFLTMHYLLAIEYVH